jgi:hypothetical protein
MYRRKQYGQSRVDKCPFCGKQATAKNSQEIPVCLAHTDRSMDNMKCVCGGWLDLRAGKWGPYFHCMNCGNINFRKGLEMNPDFEKNESRKEAKGKTSLKIEKNAKRSNPEPTNKKDKNTKKETVVTSDELDFLY